ncbi:MAG TPA: cytochrome b [Pseudomonadales bacterium]|nr:cytochrome b [Pseudomonadales bacterium]
MRLRNSGAGYGAVTQALHWVIAALIVVQWVLAELAEAAHHAKATHPAAALQELALLARHKSIGLTIFALAVVRLVWRFASPPPPLPATMPRWQVRGAKLTHFAFYALLFLLPISGLVMSAAANFPVSYFGLFTIPNVVAPDESLVHVMKERHELLFNALVALAALHVAAALKHQFIDRDDVLRKMLPWRTR